MSVISAIVDQNTPSKGPSAVSSGQNCSGPDWSSPAALVYTQHLRIRSTQVNRDRVLRTSSLLRLFQEISIAHTTALGMGRAKTLDKGLLWVIFRQEVSIRRMPVYDERVILRSYPGKMTGVFFPRYYEIWPENSGSEANAAFRRKVSPTGDTSHKAVSQPVPSPFAGNEVPPSPAGGKVSSLSAGDRVPSPSAGNKVSSSSAGDKVPSPFAGDKVPSSSAGNKVPSPSGASLAAGDSLPLVTGQALWLLMDAGKRTMVFPDRAGISIPGSPLAPASDIPALLRCPPEITLHPIADYHTRFSQIDLNGHVNNANYYDILEDLLFSRSSGGFPAGLLSHIQAEYDAEIREGETVQILGGSADTPKNSRTAFFEGHPAVRSANSGYLSGRAKFRIMLTCRSADALENPVHEISEQD